MSATKISLTPAIVTGTHGTPASAPDECSKRVASAPAVDLSSEARPALSSRPRAPAPPAEAGSLGPGARCIASSLTPFGEKLNVETARLLPALLGIHHGADGEPGRITRDALLKAIASPLPAKDLSKLPVQWPAGLVDPDALATWTGRLVAACDGVYEKQGLQAYIEALTDLIFDEGSDDAGLPGDIRDFCAMLTKNALEAGIEQGLDQKALHGLRNTVVIRFLMGSVFVPHLRPTAMRESTQDSGLYAFDRQLFKRFSQKTTEIIDIDAEAMLLLAVSRQTKKQARAQTVPLN